MSKLTGKILIEWGFEPGPSFKYLLKEANRLKSFGHTYEHIRNSLEELQKTDVKYQEIQSKPLLESPVEWSRLIEIDGKDDIAKENFKAVEECMNKVMRFPFVSGGAVLPDACPAGVLPVGGVVVSDHIHPSWHSADICCSVACTEIEVKGKYDAATLTDLALGGTHFGIGSNPKVSKVWKDIVEQSFPEDNIFLSGLKDRAVSDIGTQGDGNHFLFIGERQSTGGLCIVTHHGSRSLGAQLYRRGIRAAEKESGNKYQGLGKSAFFERNTELGTAYWDALQYVRKWTKMNHLCVHTLVMNEWREDLEFQTKDYFWNEHNFVFDRNGKYYHAKGATPNYAGFANDDSGKTMVPLNMGEPILILEHTDNGESFGFAPHGAGRNLSRTAYLKSTDNHRYPEGVEVRFYTGEPDHSELPNAYKPAEYIRSHIESKGLGKIVDQINPLGSIMAGHIDWGKGKQKRKPRSERK